MALVEKNDNLKGKTVKLDGLMISWDDAPETEESDGLKPETEDKPVLKKVLKTKNDDLKTKKVVI